MSKNIILLYIFFILLLLNSRVARAGEFDFHKPIPCSGCHFESSGIGADYGSGDCGQCHEYNLPNVGINVELLESKHNPNICKKCHMGNTMVNASEKDLFHNGHNNVNCNICHTQDNFTVIKIEGIEKKGFKCVICHGNKVHGIHAKNLDKICTICHGSWANGKVYNKVSSSSNNVSQINAKLESFTIFAFIKHLFNVIFGVI